MSILRLSVLKDTIYAPDAAGNLVYTPYNKRTLQGQMESVVEPQLLAKDSAFAHYLTTSLKEKTAKLSDKAPVVVMVHGFLFDPKMGISPTPKDTDNPHGRLYHFVNGVEDGEIRHHTSGWPLHLGFGEKDEVGKDGLAIAFGWHSQPGFASSLIERFQNFYARAYDYAGLSAWVLMNLLLHLRAALPGKPIHLLCHSLGSRVVVRALAQLAKHQPDAVASIGQVVVVGGAEYVVEAQLMMRRLMTLPIKQRPSFYNIVARENDVLDKLGENFGPRTFGNTQVIGHNGLDAEQPGDQWLDLQIDGRKLQAWLAEHKGLAVSGDQPDNVWDHWYYYTYRNNMALYRNIFREPAAWRIPALRKAGIPDRVSKRWSIFGD